jgi:hypothetical protein
LKNDLKEFELNYSIITQKAKKPQQVRVISQMSCSGFYSILIIGRAVTGHFSLSQFES